MRSKEPLVEIIFADQELLSDKSGDMVGKTPSDYVDLYYQIKDKILKGEKLKILIRNRTLLSWLKPLEIKYDHEYIGLKTVTHRSALSEKWMVEVPDYVTDEAIKNLNLLNIGIIPKEGQVFSEIILEQFFSELMLQNKFPLYRIVDLISSFDMNEWQENLKVKLLNNEYSKRVEQWIKASTDENERRIIDIFAKNPDELNRKLMLYKVIENYPPEYGRRILEDDYKVFMDIGLNLDGLIIEEEKIEEALSHIKIFFHTLEEEIPDQNGLMKALSCISGHSVEEFSFIKKLLSKNPKLVDDKIIGLIEERIKPILILPKIRRDFEEIRALVEPNKPDKPNAKWSSDQWIDWALNQYFPYRFWLENLGKTDPFITEVSDAFGNWYYENYLKLREERNILYKLVLNNKDAILQSKLNLFIVIDNFNYKFAMRLEELFETKGYSITEKETYMSLLPTETRYSKRALLYGDFDMGKIPSSYERIVEDWPKYLGVKKVKYLRNLSELEKIDSIEHDIYFLNYLPIDNVLHEREDAIGETHEKEVYNKLQEMVEKVDEFITTFQIANDISVYICSDHGSTKIGSKEHNGIDLKYFTEKEIPIEHARFVSIDKDRYGELADHVKNACFYLDKDIYALDENILIAKEYFRFKEVNESFYVHGGASPEEVLVPFYIFKKHTEDVKTPMLKILTNEFRYVVKSLLKIEISNPNQYPLVDVRLSVLNREVEVKETVIEEVSKLDVISIEVPCRFYKGFDGSEDLEIRMVYEFAGKRHEHSFKFPIKLRSMIEAKFDFDIFKK